jgi:membrane protein required for colicin V production
MPFLDILIAIVVVISLIVGLVRGFVKEVLSIIGWIAAAWLAFTFGSNAGELIHQYVELPAEAFRTSAGFISVFVVSLFVFSVVNWLIAKILSKAPIKGIDRFLGMLFGAVRAVAVIAIVIVIGRGFNMNESAWWQRSVSVAYFNPAADVLESLLPARFQSNPPEVDANAEPSQMPEELRTPNAEPSSAVLDIQSKS